ncbi:hypothetical protein CLV84_0701 [Neolewinella xylanilytica]|uniref:Uncharacterized protein n=2 Tax=Neolewinella xylanilytica TaxID=1514080 RepID=A0A2S6I8D1_9BACT|nr:hypothetical protein CLV84_0701 [Neolewinella xylanilytica]
MKLVPIFTLLLVCQHATAQDYSLPRPETRTTLTEADLREMLTVQFSKFITSNSNAVLGSFAGFSTINGQFELGATLIPSNNFLITTKVSAGAIEGVAGLFNNGKLNSKVTMNAAGHRLLNLNNQPDIRFSPALEYRSETEKAQELSKYSAEVLKYTSQQPLLQARLDLENETTTLSQINSKLSVLGGGVANPVSPQFQKDTTNFKILEYQKAESLRKITILKSNIDVMKKPGYFDAQVDRANERIRSTLHTINQGVSQLTVSGLNVHWITLGLGVERDRFTLLSVTDSVEMVSEFVTHTGRRLQLAFSHYRYNDPINQEPVEDASPQDLADPIRDEYWSVGAKYGRGNNAGSLKSATLRETSAIPGDSSRVYYTEQKVLQGKFRDELDELTLYINYYRFFTAFADTRAAYHIYPSLWIRDGYEPEVSLTVGLLYPFHNQKSPESIANVEIFLQFRNLMNDRIGQNGIGGGSTVGLTATFPIDFLTN